MLTRTFSTEQPATEHAHKESSRSAGVAYFPQAPKSEQPQGSKSQQAQTPKNERPQTSKSHQTQTTMNNQATEAPILEEEEEYLAAPLLELAKKFNERLDQFFERSTFRYSWSGSVTDTPTKSECSGSYLMPLVCSVL